MKVAALSTAAQQAVAFNIHDQTGGGGKFLDSISEVAEAINYQFSPAMMKVAAFQKAQYGGKDTRPEMKDLSYVKGGVPETRVGIAGIDDDYKKKRDKKNDQVLQDLKTGLDNINYSIAWLKREGVKTEASNNAGGMFTPFGLRDTPMGPK